MDGEGGQDQLRKRQLRKRHSEIQSEARDALASELDGLPEKKSNRVINRAAARIFRAEHKPKVDKLTGLTQDRAVFEQQLDREIARAYRNKSRFNLMLIDMNGMKKINDAHGHNVGDQALKYFGESIREAIRGEDLAVRWGGDEFVVLLVDQEELDESQADPTRRVGQRFQTNLYNRTFEDPRFKDLSASIGVVEFEPMEENLTGSILIDRADTAMYMAKKKGGTHLERWNSQMTKPAEVTSRK